MMQALLFDEQPHGASRKSDPPTSKKAARAFNPTSINQGILDLLNVHFRGLTIAELSQDLHRKEVSVSPRICGLVDAGLIRDSGNRRRNPGSKQEAIVWVLAQTAQSVAMQIENVRDKLPLLYEREDILLTTIQQRGDVERVSSRNMRIPLQIRPGEGADATGKVK